MRRGNTATISIQQFRADWDLGIPIADLCSNYTISRDQVIRLRDVWSLPLRHDRRARKPRGNSVDPTPDQIRERCLEIQAGWDDATREARHWKNAAPYVLQVISIPDNGVGIPDDPEIMDGEYPPVP